MSTFGSQLHIAEATSEPIRRALRRTGLDPSTPPTASQWQTFLAELERTVEGVDDGRYENLFAMSPVPTLEQDYTRLVERMEALRSEGVRDIRTWLGTDMKRIRDMAELIDNVSLNPAAIEIIGLSPEDAAGPVRREIVNPEAAEAWVEQFALVWAGDCFGVTTFRAARPSGEQFEARRTMAVPMGRFGPDYSRVVMTIEDISEQRAEERRMQDALESRTRFLASVSHEIRTPLTGILGFAEVLADSPELAGADEGANIIRSIHDGAKDLSDIVDDLLLSAQSELGSIPMADEPVEVNAEITRVLSSGGAFPERVRRTGDDLDATARGDAGRLRQIIRNLLTNAERYGGDDVAIEVRDADGVIAVEVSDDGPGVPDGMAEQIFEPYRRGHDASTTPDSVGIGLAICRQFADLMGGSLTYRRSGDRSRFVLTLPQDAIR